VLPFPRIPAARRRSRRGLRAEPALAALPASKDPQRYRRFRQADATIEAQAGARGGPARTGRTP